MSQVQLPKFGATIALVGRTNVGKSTLFNRVLEQTRALVSPMPGTTRDRSYGTTMWQGVSLTFIDTGGLDMRADSDIEVNVVRQAERAIAEADLICMVTDAITGTLPQDVTLAHRLRKQKNKPVILVANKADNPRRRAAVRGHEWARLNLGKPALLSASNGSGVGDFLDLVVAALPKAATVLPIPEAATRIAIIGKPNVGKSSLLNALVGEERAIVSPIPGTTREPEDTMVMRNELPYLLVDTAGIRKRGRIIPGLERSGVERSLRAMERAEVVFFVLDISEPPAIQDMHLADVIQESGRAVVIIANKWDLIRDKRPETMTRLETVIRRFFPHLSFAPLRFVSARDVDRTAPLYDDARLVKAEWSKTLDSASLDTLMRQAMIKTGHGKARGRPYLYGLKQTASKPPKFMTSQRGAKTKPPAALVHILERELRRQFGFIGTPVTIEVKPVTRHIPRA